MTMFDRRSAVELASFITQGFHRIAAGRPPGWNDAEDDAQSQRDDHDIGDLIPVDLRRYLGEQVKLGREEVAPGQILQPVSDSLDIADEEHRQHDADERA